MTAQRGRESEMEETAWIDDAPATPLVYEGIVAEIKQGCPARAGLLTGRLGPWYTARVSTTNKIRVALCGYGPMARMHAELLGKQPDVVIVGVADAEADLRARAEREIGVRAFETAEALVDAVPADAAIVATPTFRHAQHTIHALRKGLHVLCEKPMALDAAECEEMARVARDTGRMLTVGHVLRYWPEYVYLKRAVVSGELGKLRTLSMQRIGNVTRGWKDWFLDEKLGGTQIFDRHIHDSDLVLWLLGKPTAVRTIAREEPVGGAVHCFTQYLFPDVTAVAEGSADCAPRYPFTMAYTAAFEKATVHYSSRLSPTLTLYGEDGEVTVPALPNPLGEAGSAGLNITSTSGYFFEQRVFLDCIRNGTPPSVVTPETGRDTVALVRLEMQSVRTGAAVPVA
jgi:predicted dehydrogenase